MTPDQIDELARALYARLYPTGNFDQAWPVTQEGCRNGVRVVLERAGQLGDSARVDAERWEAHAETQIARAVAAEKDLVSASEKLAECRAERDALKAHNAILTTDIEGWKRQNELLRKGMTELDTERDEQKARADRAEADLDNERRRAVKIIGPLRERISALEKAIREFLKYARLEHPVDALAAEGLRAALDAPQPNQDRNTVRVEVRRDIVGSSVSIDSPMSHEETLRLVTAAVGVAAMNAGLNMVQVHHELGFRLEFEHKSSARITPEDGPLHIPDSGQPGSAGSSAGNQDVSAPSGSVASPPAQPGCSSPIPDGVLIAAAVYECVVLDKKEGGLPEALNANGQFAGLDYGLDLGERLRARKEARSK